MSDVHIKFDRIRDFQIRAYHQKIIRNVKEALNKSNSLLTELNFRSDLFRVSLVFYSDQSYIFD